MDGFHALSLFLMYLSIENDFLQDNFISLIHLKILIHDTAFSLSQIDCLLIFRFYNWVKRTKWGHISQSLVPLEFFKNQTWSLVLQAVSEIAPIFLRNTGRLQSTQLRAVRLYWLSVQLTWQINRSPWLLLLS